MSFVYDDPRVAASAAVASAPITAIPPSDPTIPVGSEDRVRVQLSEQASIRMSTPRPGVGELIRTPADTALLKNWCDRVAIKWRLTSDQLSDLKQLVEQGASLDTGHLRLCLWNQTTIYHMLNKVEAQSLEYESFKTTMNEVQKQVAAAWAPSKGQHTTIRVVTRDMLISPTRTSYMQLARDVMNHLQTNQAKLGLENAFTTPAREGCLETLVKKKASNARTMLRSTLILSIAGRCIKPLEDTTFDILSKFRKGGVGSRTDPKVDYQIVIALLRRWTFEDHWQGAPAMKAYLNAVKDSEDDDENQFRAATSSAPPAGAGSFPGTPPDEDSDDDTEQSSKKRRLNPDEAQVMHATVGRVPKGEDFFSKMDGRWKVSLDLWGASWKQSEIWKAYINDTISRDRAFFGKPTNSTLPSIPATPLNTPSSTESVSSALGAATAHPTAPSSRNQPPATSNSTNVNSSSPSFVPGSQSGYNFPNAHLPVADLLGSLNTASDDPLSIGHSTLSRVGFAGDEGIWGLGQ